MNLDSNSQNSASHTTQSVQEGAATLLILALAILAGLSRLLPHPPNVTLLTAASLLAGALLPRKLFRANALILLGVLISDLALGLHSTLPFVYAGLAFGPLFAAWSTRSSSAFSQRMGRSLVAAGGASLGFFVLSNLGVFLVGGIYPMTWVGLVDCFVMALPFWRSSLIADLGFGVPALIWVAPWLKAQLLAPMSVNSDAVN
jgi:hypothetical protein